MESQTSKKWQLELQEEVGDVTGEDFEEIRATRARSSKQGLLGKAQKQLWRSSQTKSTRSSTKSWTHCLTIPVLSGALWKP